MKGEKAEGAQGRVKGSYYTSWRPQREGKMIAARVPEVGEGDRGAHEERKWKDERSKVEGARRKDNRCKVKGGRVKGER